MTPDVVEKGVRSFKDNFQGSLEKWRSHCVKIASSKFLMGEKKETHFDIKILFALSQKLINQLSEGKYELNTRDSNHLKKIKALEAKVKTIAVKKDVLTTQLGHLEDEKKRDQKHRLAQKKKGLSPEILAKYKYSYEALMINASTGEGSRFRDKGWEDSQVQFMFDLFVDKDLKSSLEATEKVALVEQEEFLKNQKGSLQSLYDFGLQALKELRREINPLSSRISVSHSIELA